MSRFGFDRLEDRLTSWAPRARRRMALHCLVWSIVLMVINVGLYVAGVIDESHLILVTLILSWLAITFTAADLVATTDVREEEEAANGNSAGDESAGHGSPGRAQADRHDATDDDDAMVVAGDGDGGRAPVYATLDSVVSVVAAAPAPVYVRFSAGPHHDREQPSVDHLSGLELPGLSANPLTPPGWWRQRPVGDWVMRQLCAYRHLQEDDDDRHCWLVAGTEAGRGPDNEPLLVDVVTLGVIANDVLTACGDLGEAPPWHAVS